MKNIFSKLKNIKGFLAFFKKIRFGFVGKLITLALVSTIVYWVYDYRQYILARYDFIFNTESAEDYYILAIKANPIDSKAYYDLAKIYIKNKNYTKTIDLLNDGIEHGVKGSKLYELIGVAQFLSGNINKAKKSLNMAIDLSDQRYEAYYYLGKINEKFIRYEKAILDYKTSIRIDKNFVDAYYALTQLYRKLNEYSNAKYYAKKAIKVALNDVRGYTNLASLYIDTRDYNLATRELNIAKDIDSNFYDVYYQFGRLYYKKKQYAFAIENLKKAIKLRSDSKAYELLGKIYDKKPILKPDLRADL